MDSIKINHQRSHIPLIFCTPSSGHTSSTLFGLIRGSSPSGHTSFTPSGLIRDSPISGHTSSTPFELIRGSPMSASPQATSSVMRASRDQSPSLGLSSDPSAVASVPLVLA